MKEIFYLFGILLAGIVIVRIFQRRALPPERKSDRFKGRIKK
ncbi:MAG: hypothetical protein AAGB22_11265 [Bacteroidota bacterium]